VNGNGAVKLAKRWLRPGDRPWVQGLEWKDAFRGLLDTEAGAAEVLVEGSWVRMRAWPNGVGTAGDALSRNACLPSNVRYAGVPPRISLVVDTWLDRPDFRRGVSDMRRALRDVTHPGGPARFRGDAHEASVASALGALAAEPGVDLVDLDGQWEVGVRYSGCRVPVRVTPERSALRVQRTVLDAPQSEASREAVHHMALRLNERTRFARLATCGDRVIAEARISQTSLANRRLIDAARAVAVVSVEAQPQLQILMRQERVARCYAAMFHPNGDDAT
jgi:hypothetical protein